MKTNIPVYKHGVLAAWALVDEDDFDRLSQHSWWLNSDGYATSAGTSMQRLVVGAKYLDGTVVHHINEDKLDNRRANLRVFDSASEHATLFHSRRDASSFSEGRNKEIWLLHRAGRSLRDIGELYGISKQRVHKIVTRRQKVTL